MRRWLRHGIVGLGLMLALSGAVSAQTFTAQIQAFWQFLLNTSQNWVAPQNFTDISISGVCNGCNSSDVLRVFVNGSVLPLQADLNFVSGNFAGTNDAGNGRSVVTLTDDPTFNSLTLTVPYNPFDQSLNTTDSPTFANISIPPGGTLTSQVDGQGSIITNDGFNGLFVQYNGAVLSSILNLTDVLLSADSPRVLLTSRDVSSELASINLETDLTISTLATGNVIITPAGVLHLNNIPASDAGLSAGDVYQVAGVLMIKL